MSFAPSGRVSRYAGILLASSIAVALIHLQVMNHVGILTPDADQYIAIAKGHSALEPFASRAFVPRAAALLGRTLGLPLDHAFMAIKLLSLFAFCAAVVAVLDDAGVPPSVSALMITVTEGIVHVYSLTFLPDLELAALMAVSILLYSHNRIGWSLVIASLAVLARETAVVFLLGIGLVEWWRSGRWTTFMSAAALAVFAFVLRASLAGPTPGNMHGISPLWYMGLKIPVNFLSNWMGLRYFTSTGVECGEVWLVFPQVLTELVGITKAGLCRPDLGYVFRTLSMTFYPLGAAAGVGLALWKHRGAKLVLQDPVLVVCLAVGLSLWMLGTVTGTWIDRLVAMGWPLALVVVPTVFRRECEPSAGHWMIIVLLYFAAGKVTSIRLLFGNDTGPELYWLVTAAFLVAVQVVAMYFVSQMLKRPGTASETAERC